jgi:hypothetical protein
MRDIMTDAASAVSRRTRRLAAGSAPAATAKRINRSGARWIAGNTVGGIGHLLFDRQAEGTGRTHDTDRDKREQQCVLDGRYPADIAPESGEKSLLVLHHCIPCVFGVSAFGRIDGPCLRRTTLDGQAAQLASFWIAKGVLQDRQWAAILVSTEVDP